jgi:hypothetical protein
MAISAKYSKALIQRQFIVDMATETATDIYQMQLPIAKNRGWQNIARQLSGTPFQVLTNGRGVVLVMPYLMQMRFMDMRKDAHGKTKKYYTPIYNKIVWGMIYGYLYKRLIYGISKDMNQAITERFVNSGFNIQ